MGDPVGRLNSYWDSIAPAHQLSRSGANHLEIACYDRIFFCTHRKKEFPMNESVCCVCGSVKREKAEPVEGRKLKKYKGARKHWDAVGKHTTCSSACSEWLTDNPGVACPFHGG